VRNNVLARNQTGGLTYMASRANARLSSVIPQQIVYCSRTAREQHEALGYRAGIGTVVENTAQSVAFGFSPLKRERLRQTGLGNNFVFLFVGRFDPVKRVDLFLQAAGMLRHGGRGNSRFVLAGRDMDQENMRLREQILSAGLADCVQLLGHSPDPQLLYSAADCLVVTSESEGSPNVIYEAMATRLPVIIMGTVGTEGLQGAGITRLPGRDVAALAQAMDSVAAAGAVPPATRTVREPFALPPVEHPLVVHYRHVLATI
jgi:glycosyltransferase involved in cell wall biosynthesis